MHPALPFLLRFFGGMSIGCYLSRPRVYRMVTTNIAFFLATGGVLYYTNAIPRNTITARVASPTVDDEVRLSEFIGDNDAARQSLDYFRRLWIFFVIPFLKLTNVNKRVKAYSTRDDIEKSVVFYAFGEMAEIACLHILLETRCPKILGFELSSSSISFVDHIQETAAKIKPSFLEHKVIELSEKSEGKKRIYNLNVSGDIVVFINNNSLPCETVEKILLSVCESNKVACVITTQKLKCKEEINARLQLYKTAHLSPDWRKDSQFCVYKKV